MAQEMKRASTTSSQKENTKIDDAVLEKENKKSETKIAERDYKDEIDSLKKQLETLQSLLIANSKTVNTSSSNEYEDGYIRSDRSIQVMSLVPNLLNLSTQGNGKGKVFKFYSYGEMKNIIYSDLSDILLNYQKFAESGVFYIFDKQVVKRHGLEQAYERILDKKAIDSFLDKTSDEIKDIFSKLSNAQKSAIVQTIVGKVVAGEDISTAKVNLIKDLYGADIFAMADEMKNWEGAVQELEK